MFVWQAFYVDHVHVAPGLNAKDADMEKALLSCDVTTEVLVK